MVNHVAAECMHHFLCFLLSTHMSLYAFGTDEVCGCFFCSSGGGAVSISLADRVLITNTLFTSNHVSAKSLKNSFNLFKMENSRIHMSVVRFYQYYLIGYREEQNCNPFFGTLFLVLLCFVMTFM